MPTDTRGKERVDDRRAISGIVHVLKSSGRWSDAPREIYRPKKTLYNRFVCWTEKGVWTGPLETLAQEDGPPAQVLLDSSAVKALRSAAGAKGQGHAIGRPLAFPRTGGHVADYTAGASLLERLPTCAIVLADKGYVSDAIRAQIEASGAAPNFPPKRIAAAHFASRPCCIGLAMPSSACSAG